MRKKEAAEFLGVSTRTLERLVKEGRLRARREKGKTRPLVVFDKEDLERLKTAREEEKPPEAFGRPNTSQSLGGIGFRLDHVYIKMLEEQGKARGISAGNMARHLVIQGLEDARSDKMKDEFTAMRDGLADFYFALLIMKFGMSEEQANDLVKETLLRRREA